MKTGRWIWGLVLLLAGSAQAVNTAAVLTDKGAGASQQGLIGYVESPEGKAAEAVEPNLGSSDPVNWVVGPMLESEADVPVEFLSDSSELGPQADNGDGQQSGSGLNDPHWSLNLLNGPDADVVNASRRVDLPSFSEIDWVATPLPAAKKTSLMVVVVFPALGMLAVVFLATLLIRRARRHRPLDQSRQLLRV